MNKYQEALNKVLYDNPKVQLTTSDIHSSIGLLQEENTQLKALLDEIRNITLSYNPLNSGDITSNIKDYISIIKKQKKILDVLKNNVDICIDYKGKNPNDICFLLIYHDDGGKAIVNEISKEQYELFEEWKNEND